MKRLGCILLLLFVAFTAFSNTRKAIVLRAQFQDVAFTLPEERMVQLADSASLYFTTQFAPGTEFIFELGPVVTLEAGMAYYGRNTSFIHDQFIYKALIEACLDSEDEVDFSQYDGIVLLTAGPDESDGASDDAIWPQKCKLSDWSSSLVLDGRTIDDFAVSTEYAGLGTFCHEFAHLLGLCDLYDADGPGSGGVSKALWGNLSLMDKGDKNGPQPPNFCAIELDQLGLGKCDTLKAGTYMLAPLERERHYLKALSPTEGEYFLFECRDNEGWDSNLGCSGLVIYHVDRSAMDAGYSDYYKKTLKAQERWFYNQVNCVPDRQCAYLVAAVPDATDISQVTFPQGGADSFTASTEPPFCFHDGSASKLAVTGITRLRDNGGVQLTVLEPITIGDITTYQDAATVRWTVAEELGAVKYCEVEWWKDGEENKSVAPVSGSCCTIEGLEPQTRYNFYVSIVTVGGSGFSTWSEFTTRAYRPGSVPYIDLGTAPRIPLRVINLPTTAKAFWTFSGEPIKPEEDGFYTLPGNGILKVRIEDSDGNIHILVKEVNSK